MNPLARMLAWMDERTYEWRIWKPLNAVINRIWRPGPK